MKSLIIAASLAVLLAGPALGGEATMNTTPQLALPESEMEAIAPFKRCSGRETVYLTN